MARLHMVHKPFKIPESVLVVIHTPALEVLLIQRADTAQGVEHWQSVTGSKDHWDDEARRDICTLKDDIFGFGSCFA